MPRRILAVSRTARLSGAEAVLLRVVEHLHARGWSVVVASPAGPLVDRVRNAGIDWIRIPDLSLQEGRRTMAMPLLAGRTVRASLRIRRESRRCDIVLVNSFLALPALALARIDPPLAWLVHDVIVRPNRLRLLRLCAPVVDLAIAVSDAAARPMRVSGIPSRVIRNGTPWPVSPAPPQRPGPAVIGCNALLTPWKGQDVLLEAVARLQRPEVSVELMGGTFPKDGGFEAALRARASRPDLSGRVRLLGHVPDPLARVRLWSVAVVSSVEPEAGSLAVVEAMSVGVPLVVTNHGGPPEVLGAAGLLVPSGDIDAMAEAIRLLLDNPDRRRLCAEAGPRQVAAALTLDHQLESVFTVLDKLAEPHVRPGRGLSKP